MADERHCHTYFNIVEARLFELGITSENRRYAPCNCQTLSHKG